MSWLVDTDELMQKLYATTKLIPPGDLVQMITQGAGTGSMQNAHDIGVNQADEQEALERETRDIVTRLESAWQGEGADAARERILPLVDVAAKASDTLHDNANVVSEQVSGFDRMKGNLHRDVPNQPPDPGAWGTITPWDTDSEDALNAYHKKVQENQQVYAAYRSQCEQNAPRMKIDYGQLQDIEGREFDVGKGTGGSNGLGDAGQGSVGPRGPGPSVTGGGPRQASTWQPSTAQYAPPNAPQQTVPSGQNSQYPSFTPGQYSPGQYNPGYQAPGYTDDGGTTAASYTSPGGFGPGFGPSGFGPSGNTSGFGPSGSSYYGGSGGSSYGGSSYGGFGSSGSTTGGSTPSPGRSSGVAPPASGGRGGSYSTPTSSGSSSSGSRMGRMPMGMGGGKGQGGEDSEHERPGYLLESDPNSLFGTDEKTVPPVIGE